MIPLKIARIDWSSVLAIFLFFSDFRYNVMNKAPEMRVYYPLSKHVPLIFENK